MQDAMTIIVVTTGAYLATSIDNFTILLALFGRFPQQGVQVLAGHLFVTAAVILLALGLGEAATFLPLDYVGYLGVIPLGLGVYLLWQLLRAPISVRGAAPDMGSAAVVIATVASLAGNSVDTLLTMAVVLADARSDLDLLVLLTALAVAFAIGAAARATLGNAAVGPAVAGISKRLAPFVMIGIGAYVLANTATDIVPGG